MKEALLIFKKWCVKSWADEHRDDDMQEAICICLKRSGKEFWEQPTKHIVLQLIRAMNEAHRNNMPYEQRTNREPLLYLNDRENYEENQPLYKSFYDDRPVLDKLVKRATLSNHQLQIFYMFMRGDTGKCISDTFGIHVNSVTNILNAVRDKLHAVRVGALV